MRSLFANLLISIFSLLFFYGAGELTVRVLQHTGHLPDYARKPQNTDEQKQINANNPKLRKSDNPKLHVEYDPSDTRVNALGMRGPMPDSEKPADSYRIAVIGDSVAFGFGLTREQSFPFLLEEHLRKQTGKTVEVLNFSVVGYGMESYLEVYSQRVRPFHPDLVLLSYVLNDMTPPSAVFVVIKDVMKDQAQLKRLARYSQFAAWCVVTWREAVNKASGDHSFTAQYADPATATRMHEQLATLQQETANDHAQLFAVIFPYFTELDHYPFNNMHDVVNNAMQQAGVKHYDLLNAFRNRDAATLQLQAGDITHPNAEGNRLASEAIAEQILQQQFVQ